MLTNLSLCVSISESASAAAAAEAMTMNKHSDICHTNEFKLDERSSMISGGIRGAQSAANRCIPPSMPLDLFQWMEQRRQLAAAAAAAAAAQVSESRPGGNENEKLFS